MADQIPNLTAEAPRDPGNKKLILATTSEDSAGEVVEEICPSKRKKNSPNFSPQVEEQRNLPINFKIELVYFLLWH